MNPDWRAQLRIDFAISDSSVAEQLNSDYSEALLGFAYRPVDNDKFNALVTYNYLYDLAPAEQFNANQQQNDYQQIIDLLKFDKKNSHGNVNFVLLFDIAKPKIDCIATKKP